MKKLTVNADVGRLTEALDFINGELEASGCNAGALAQINLAVEEIFVNIANYAYGPAGGSVTIRIWAGEDAVIELEDTGIAYNPLEKPDPDINRPLSEREIGGLGIYMVKNLMDDVSYERQDNKNILKIIKKGCAEASPPAPQ